ncbi:AraC family transcriptional regulator [Pseudonocardia spinosispora]|uniref:AraC family transcriptional regulator n=1 Tax=Pseudonocardia spinosispora TaxID=103441 RepID=UPI000406B1D2|nr:AraC family transcriptional regulator [Pseudonocardia spinosispora]
MTAREHVPEVATLPPWNIGQDEGLLVQREVCRSGLLDEFRAQLNNYFYPARVETLSRDADLQTSLLSAVHLEHITIGFVRFGSEAMVDPGALGAYHINVPLSGRVASECGPRQALATPGRGAVFTPREHTVLPWWSADASQLCIKLSKASVEDELEALLGHPITHDIRFDLALDLTTAPAASWLATIRLLIEELDRADGLLARSGSHRAYLERLIIAGLLHTQPHDHLEELLAPAAPARPRTVKRVIDLIESGPEVNHTLSDLARHAGVSARRLQIAFQDALGTTPTAYHRKVRLEHARAELLDGQDSVTTVAYRWGFNHPGRFATHYQNAFGESPSQTLKHARRHG